MNMNDMRARTVRPGQLELVCGDDHLNAMLDAGVAITLWHPHLKRGGMCHFVLPGYSWPAEQPEAAEAVSPAPTGDLRYGGDAFAALCRTLQPRGIRPDEWELRLFGGAAVVGDCTAGSGAQNIHFVQQLLARLNWEPSSCDVGGTAPRCLRFDAASGDVWLWDAWRTERIASVCGT